MTEAPSDLNIHWECIEVHLADEGDLAGQGVHHLVVGVNPDTCGYTDLIQYIL